MNKALLILVISLFSFSVLFAGNGKKEKSDNKNIQVLIEQCSNIIFFEQDLIELTNLPAKYWRKTHNELGINTVINYYSERYVIQTGNSTVDFLIILVYKTTNKEHTYTKVTEYKDI